MGLAAADSSVEVGRDKLLDIQVGLPQNEVSVKCSSSDRNIVQVNNDGVVTGVSPGTATITITATNLTTGEYQTKVVEVSVTGSGWGYGTTGDPVPDEDNDQRN